MYKFWKIANESEVAVFSCICCSQKEDLDVDSTYIESQNRIFKNMPNLPSVLCPVELPLSRSTSTDCLPGDEQFRTYIRSSKLPKQLKTALCQDGVFIDNPIKIVAHLEEMVRAGADGLQVISDFDATLTRYHRDGKPCHTSFGVLETNTNMPLSYRDKMEKLLQKYRPIEMDHNMVLSEKIRHMEEWCLASHTALVETKVKQSCLRGMVEQSTIEMRDNSEILFSQMDRHNIPLMIYSAGVGDLILEVLNLDTDVNTWNQPPMVVANFLKFNEEGVINGFNEELIHVLNKHEIFPHHIDYFEKHETRRNILLLGDALGDLRMADGVPEKDNVVTIGFLNSKIEAMLPIFQEKFDIVLVDDQSLDVPIAILDAVTSNKSVSEENDQCPAESPVSLVMPDTSPCYISANHHALIWEDRVADRIPWIGC